MKKGFLLILATVIIVTSVFASCSKKQNLTAQDLADSNNEYGYEFDENGNEVFVEYFVDEDGNTVAVQIDNNGERVTNESGELVTVHTDYQITTGTSTQLDDIGNTDKLTTTTAPSPTATTNQQVATTKSNDTTKFEGMETVPKTTATGKEVTFTQADQEIISSMLEVPYLYLANYENSDGVPISIACHTAVWMAEHEGNIRTTYPASSVVLNLFKFYGQTVVNFKTQCNDSAPSVGAPISYNKSNDTFDITEYTSKKQSVTITKIEDLGDNNFYKVTGTVTGCDKTKVVAVIQKNKLELSLGFSIKALHWS